MKFKKSVIVLSLITLLTGCGNNSDKESSVEGTTTIKFLVDGNSTSSPAWKELVEAYNNGQGKTDKVKVVIDKITKGSSENCKNEFIKSSNYANNVVCVSEKVFHTYAIQKDSKKCPNGYFLDLTKYAEADEDYKNNKISSTAKNWMKMTYSTDLSSKKHIVGPNENVLGVPYAADPQMTYYNKNALEQEKVNIISVSEEDLASFNEKNNASYLPHGYAEYKVAPQEGLVASTNLAGETVYKVFNRLIPMNWEETRYVFKMFTKSYNSSSLTNYGFISEYWFNYGWSVGGDCMGFNGTDYDFTLVDKSANYLVTKDGVNVNGSTYNKGDIVRYEDKVNQNNITNIDGLHAIASQYDAVKQYVSLQVKTNTLVDNDNSYGYGIADPDVGSAQNAIKSDQVAFIRSDYDALSEITSGSNGSKLELCVPEQYRVYKNGSTYQKDGNNGFANEYLKVIGETYDGVTYTGELETENGTPIVGKKTDCGYFYSLVVPACSDPDKYQASWDFISWVSSTEGQNYIAKTGNVMPLDSDVLKSDAFLNQTFNNRSLDLKTFANAANDLSMGDWGYFESGEWVTRWANNFNQKVRYGIQTLSDFESQNSSVAKEDLNGMKIIIKGIR